MQLNSSISRRLIIIFIFCFATLCSYSKDSTYLKVHFLYGSKPLKKYRDTEKKWFGGVLGGHVGIEADSNKVLNFVSGHTCHLFGTKKKKRRSGFVEFPVNSFYSIFGGEPDSMKKAVVYIPITMEQKQRFDSIASLYVKQAPYDYAVFGMRCGAAAYDILGQLNILPVYSHTRTYKKIFYPKKLRKRLFKKANKNHWTIVSEDGSGKRRWERD